MSQQAEVIDISSRKVSTKKRTIKSKYPVEKGTLRPFRLWDAKKGKQLRWRNYAFAWTAVSGAWEEIQWAKVNQSIEVFNIRTGQHIATFTMKPGNNVHRFVKSEFNFRFKRTKKS